MGGGGFPIHFTTEWRMTTSSIADRQGERNLQYDVCTWLDQQGIRHFSTHGDAKPSVVERLNRMFKGRMYCYFTPKCTRDYLSVLPALVDGYNQSRHQSIRMAPKVVTEQNEKQVWYRLIQGSFDGKFAFDQSCPAGGQMTRITQIERK